MRLTCDRILAASAVYAAAMACAGCKSEPADATPYPSRAIKLYVPFGAGGGSDTFARIIQKAIDDHDLLPQPIAIINLEGAGATIGSRRVKDAKPDGYTILHLHEAIMTAQAMGKVLYGPEAFEPIAATGEIGMVLTVSAESPYQTLGELLARAKSQPDTLAYAANLGAPSHYAGLLLEQAYPGAKFRYVQYGGGEARFTAIKGGHIHVSAFSIEEYRRFRTIGLRALAYFGRERHPALLDVPSTYEQGLEVAFSNIYYWWAPKGTPQERIDVFADALQAAMQTPQVQNKLAEIYCDPIFLRGEALKQHIDYRMQQIAGVSSRQTMKLPNFPAIILGIIGVLIIAVGVQMWRATPDAKTVARSGISYRIDLAVVTVVMTLIYVGVMATDRVGFRIATIVFILAVGLTLARPTPRVIAATGTIALTMGLGLHYLLTQVFFVDLP